MAKNQVKAAEAIVTRSVKKAGGRIHRRGVNMAPAVKKEEKKQAKKGENQKK